jgi:hypothetical protein
MSPSKAEVSVFLAGGRGEIDIISGALAVVASGVGKIEKQPLEPGIYKAVSRIGHARTEQLFAVQPNALPVTVRLPAPRFASAIPLDNTSTSHEYQQAGVADALGALPENISAGDGGRLFICLRDPWTAPETDVEKLPQYATTFDGFRLLDATTGAILADLDQRARRSPQRRMATLAAMVKPGAYILEYVRAANAAVQMPVYVVPGWQALVFVNVTPASDVAAGTPDLPGRSVVYAPAGYPFHGWDEQLQLAEVARVALSNGRGSIANDDLRLLLDGKFDNPMLGIFAAHLLLRRGPESGGLFATVVKNVSAMLGANFPDIAALRFASAAADLGPRTPVDQPPLLQASWGLLQRDLRSVVAGSIPARVAPMLVPNGIWTAWQPLPNEPVARPAKRRAKSLVTAAFDAGLRRVLESATASTTLSSALEHLHVTASSDEGARAPDAAIELLLSIARHPETAGFLESARASTLRSQLMRQLTPYQKMLLPTLEALARQIAGGEQFTLDDMRAIILGYGLPLQMAAGELGDLAVKLHALGQATG